MHFVFMASSTAAKATTKTAIWAIVQKLRAALSPITDDRCCINILKSRENILSVEPRRLYNFLKVCKP